MNVQRKHDDFPSIHLMRLFELITTTSTGVPTSFRIEFMASVQKGLDQLERGEGIPHDEGKKQLASWLTS